MVRVRFRPVALLTLTCALIVQPAVWAQQASGIAGVVKDASGAVLPGVTVEAASPALIEKVRTVVTDTARRAPRDSLTACRSIMRAGTSAIW